MHDHPDDLDHPADVDLQPRVGRGRDDLGQVEVGPVDGADEVAGGARRGDGRPRAVVADRLCVKYIYRSSI